MQVAQVLAPGVGADREGEADADLRDQHQRDLHVQEAVEAACARMQPRRQSPPPPAQTLQDDACLFSCAWQAIGRHALVLTLSRTVDARMKLQTIPDQDSHDGP